MDPNPKFVRLLQRIRKATEAGQVHWEETLDEDSFRLILDRGMVRIGFTWDEIRETGQYHAFLFDDKKRTVAYVSEGPSDSALLPDLYSLARQDARNGDTLIDDMIEDLEAKLPR